MIYQSSSYFKIFWFSLFYVVFQFQSFLVLTVLCRLPISKLSGSLCTLSSSYFVFSGSLCTLSSSYFMFSGSLCTLSSSYFIVFWFSLYCVFFLFHSFLVLTVLCLLPISKFPGSHWNLSSSYFKVFWFSLYCVFFLFHSFMVLSVLSPNIVKQFRHTLFLIN